MKHIYIFIGFLFACQLTAAQIAEAQSDKFLRDQVIKEVTNAFQRKTNKLDSTVAASDKKIDQLNKQMPDLKDANAIAKNLQARLNLIESRQTAIEEGEMIVYQVNFQSAVINLVSMEREIKPLVLFKSTKDFYGFLEDVSNPMNYSGYNEWYKTFQNYLEANKSGDALLNVSSTLLKLTGDLSGKSPLTGMIAQALFQSISKFITSLGAKKKELREQSEKMFALTVKLAHFTDEKNLIETEWESIAKELDELQQHYEELKKVNFQLLKISPQSFTQKFTHENDAYKRLNFLNNISSIAANSIEKLKINSPKDWKEVVYYQMMDVQALKIRFGRITFKIKENIEKYNSLVQRYKSDPELGSKIPALESRLQELAETFDKTFSPLDYISSATRMFKVM